MVYPFAALRVALRLRVSWLPTLWLGPVPLVLTAFTLTEAFRDAQRVRLLCSIVLFTTPRVPPYHAHHTPPHHEQHNIARALE